jgi:hypothetical protein
MVNGKGFGPSFPGDSGNAGDSGVDFRIVGLISASNHINALCLRFDGLLFKDQLRFFRMDSYGDQLLLFKLLVPLITVQSLPRL